MAAFQIALSADYCICKIRRTSWERGNVDLNGERSQIIAGIVPLSHPYPEGNPIRH